jgi:predicted AAA+ superfamily ATPase
MAVERMIVPQVRAALADTPVVVVNGARQVGKSTLVTKLLDLPGRVEVMTLDHEPTLRAACVDPRSFVERSIDTLVIDEAQLEPRLFRAVKAAVDSDRRPGRFVLTGSARLLSLPEMADALVGRVDVVELWPFSEVELAGGGTSIVDVIDQAPSSIVESRAVSRTELADLLVRGSFPEVIGRTAGRRRAWFDAYASTSVMRVVNQIAHLERLAELPRLLRLLAARSAEELNVAKLASEFGWSARTIDSYLAQLTNAFILQLLPAWSTNLSSKVVHRPKIHLIDSGLSAALCGLTTERLLASPERFGALLETFVVMEMRKQSTWSASQPSLWHFRDRGGAEVDVVIEYPDGRVVGIEVKSGATPSHADARGLRLLRDRLGDRFHHGYLATTAPEAHPLEDRLSAIPVTALWGGTH